MSNLIVNVPCLAHACVYCLLLFVYVLVHAYVPWLRCWIARNIWAMASLQDDVAGNKWFQGPFYQQ